jgi:hypothetical protein
VLCFPTLESHCATRIAQLWDCATVVRYDLTGSYLDALDRPVDLAPNICMPSLLYCRYARNVELVGRRAGSGVYSVHYIH